MSKRLKILISAYACEPNKGSEPGVGWEYVKKLADWGDIYVITRENNRSVITDEIRKKPIDNLHFIYFDLPKWIRFLKKGARGMHIYYCFWQLFLLKKVLELHKQNSFVLFHHLTFGNMWLPTFLPFINVPFIWGPIGGGETIPSNFIKNFSFMSKLKEYIRICIIKTLRFNPIFSYCCRKAKTIIVKTKQTAEQIPIDYRNKIVVMTDVGVYKDVGINKNSLLEDVPSRIICVGKLTYWRGFDIAIKAFAKLKREHNNVSLTIVGDGPEKRRLKKIADEEGVKEKVHFMGGLSRDALNDEMSVSTIFLNTCLKEGGVTAIMEAMQRGIPVISVDTGGVTDIVPFNKTPLNDTNQVINSIVQVLSNLHQDKTLRLSAGHACRMSVEDHTWEKKARQIYGIYEHA